MGDKSSFTRDILAGFKALVLGRGNKAEDVDQKRRLTRIKSSYQVLCHVDELNFRAVVLDMSLSGMRLDIGQRVKVGSLMTVRYEGAAANASGRRFDVDSVHTRVVWCRKKRNEDRIEAGVIYDDSEDVMSRSWVKYILRQVGFEGKGIMDRRKNVRVRAHLAADMRSSNHEHVGTGEGNVVNIGAGGLLFESDVPVAVGTGVSVEIGPFHSLSKLTLHGTIIKTAHPERNGRWLLSVQFGIVGPRHTTLLGQYIRELIHESENG